MLLWVIFGALTALVVGFLVRPLVVGAPEDRARAEYDLAIYRDQLTEIDRDRDRGVLSETDVAAARLEIQRRMLTAAARRDTAQRDTAQLNTAQLNTAGEPAPRAKRKGGFAAQAVLLASPIAALALYLTLGNPNAQDAPLSGRGPERAVLAADGTLDLAKVVGVLEQRLAANPDSLDGWLLLARTDGSLNRWPAATEAYRHALGLAPGRPDILEDFGALLVAAADGAVTPQARAVLSQAVAADHARYRARYYLALADAQAGRTDAAIAAWRAMLAEAPEQAPWRPTLEAAIVEATRQRAGGVPTPQTDAQATSGPASPGGAAIAALPPAAQMTAIRGMVDGLAQRLQATPDDGPGWQRLGRAYGVLGEPAKAAEAYGKAAALSPQDPSLLVARAEALSAAAPAGTVPREATDALRRALALDPKQPDALWSLGRLEAAAGDTGQARAHWQQLLQSLTPNDPRYAQTQRAMAALPP